MHAHIPEITYTLEPNLSPQAFQQLLIASTLAERRPAHDLQRLDRMLRNATLIITARNGPEPDAQLVGIARSVTDFAYCCYLSDLAVHQAFQHRGIGRQLIHQTRLHAGPETSVILIAAPKAIPFYEAIGMPRHPAAFIYRTES